MLYQRTDTGLQKKTNKTLTVPKISSTRTQDVLDIKISDSECIGQVKLYSVFFPRTISNHTNTMLITSFAQNLSGSYKNLFQNVLLSFAQATGQLQGASSHTATISTHRLMPVAPLTKLTY